MKRSLLLIALLICLTLSSSCRTARSQTPDMPLPSCVQLGGEGENVLNICMDYGVFTCRDAREDLAAGLVVSQDCTLDRHTTVVPLEPGTAFGVLLWTTEAMDVGVKLVVQGQDLDYVEDRVLDFGLIHVDQIRSVARVLTPESRPGRTQFQIYVDGELLTTLTFLHPVVEATPIERTP